MTCLRVNTRLTCCNTCDIDIAVSLILLLLIIEGFLYQGLQVFLIFYMLGLTGSTQSCYIIKECLNFRVFNS